MHALAQWSALTSQECHRNQHGFCCGRSLAGMIVPVKIRATLTIYSAVFSLSAFRFPPPAVALTCETWYLQNWACLIEFVRRALPLRIRP